MTPKELDDFIAELKQLNEKGAREKLFIIADYNQQMLEDTYSAIELKKVLETLCPIA